MPEELKEDVFIIDVDSGEVIAKSSDSDKGRMKKVKASSKSEQSEKKQSKTKQSNKKAEKEIKKIIKEGKKLSAQKDYSPKKSALKSSLKQAEDWVKRNIREIKEFDFRPDKRNLLGDFGMGQKQPAELMEEKNDLLTVLRGFDEQSSQPNAQTISSEEILGPNEAVAEVNEAMRDLQGSATMSAVNPNEVMQEPDIMHRGPVLMEPNPALQEMLQSVTTGPADYGPLIKNDNIMDRFIAWAQHKQEFEQKKAVVKSIIGIPDKNYFARLVQSDGSKLPLLMQTRVSQRRNLLKGLTRNKKRKRNIKLFGKKKIKLL